MTTKAGKIFDLIEANDLARDHYDGTRRALEKAVWEAREKHNPQPGEVWSVLLPWHDCEKETIPAIKTATGWAIDPEHIGGIDVEGDSGFLFESQAAPMTRFEEAPATGDTE